MSKKHLAKSNPSPTFSRLSNYYGKIAEGKVADLYKQRGGKILARNFHAPRGELDLVVSYRDLLIFVEVKARSSTIYGEGIKAVDYKKKSALFHAASYFLFKKENAQYLNFRKRFDIAEYDLTNEKIKIYPNVLAWEGY